MKERAQKYVYLEKKIRLQAGLVFQLITWLSMVRQMYFCQVRYDTIGCREGPTQRVINQGNKWLQQRQTPLAISFKPIQVKKTCFKKVAINQSSEFSFRQVLTSYTGKYFFSFFWLNKRKRACFPKVAEAICRILEDILVLILVQSSCWTRVLTSSVNAQGFSNPFHSNNSLR